MFVPYCTRERVARASDVKAPAWLDAEIDAAIESASRSVDRLLRRGDDTRPAFAPWTGTIEFDWPSVTENLSWRFWLGAHSLLDISAVISGGDNITASAIGYPAQYGPPYEALDIDQSTSDTLTFTDGIGQRSLAITGTWSAAPTDDRGGWTLSGALDPADTSATILGGLSLGVGSLLRIGDERMVVTDRGWVATADTATLTASMADQSIAVASGAAYARGDDLIAGGERMRVRDIAGNTLFVQRGMEGAPLAAHTSATIYALRSCTLARAALGTTAASHADGDAVLIARYPALIEQLTVAYALDQRARETAGYGGTSAPNEAKRMAQLADLEDRVQNAYGRVLYGAV